MEGNSALKLANRLLSDKLTDHDCSSNLENMPEQLEHPTMEDTIHKPGMLGSDAGAASRFGNRKRKKRDKRTADIRPPPIHVTDLGDFTSSSDLTNTRAGLERDDLLSAATVDSPFSTTVDPLHDWQSQPRKPAECGNHALPNRPIPLSRELLGWICLNVPDWLTRCTLTQQNGLINIRMDHDMISVYVPKCPRPQAGQDGNTSGGTTSQDTQQGSSCTSPLQSQGSPQATVDETSLQKQKDKNVISLKVKLAQRRPVNQLIDQGIMPPPKTPSAFFEQRRHLERARTSDILKTKIEKRPDRQTLVEQHILEDTKIAPSLVERERKLKKAKLTDYLNDKIAHRPSPLELIQGNILKLPIFDENAINPSDGGGCLDFPNSEETARSTDNDTEYSTEEDGSSSTASSPTGALANLKDLQLTSPASVSLSAPLSIDSKASSPASSVSSSCPSQQQQLFDIRRRANSLIPSADSPATPAATSQGYPGSTGSVAPAQPPSAFTSPSAIPPTSSGGTALHNGHRRSKKCRVKPPVPQKARTLKFHEYKAPPVQNKTPAAASPVKNTAPPSGGGGGGASTAAVLQDAKGTTTYERNVRENQRLMRLMEDQQRRLDVPQAEPIHREVRHSQPVTLPNPVAAEAPRQATQHLTLTFPSQTGLMTGVQFQPIRVVQQQPQQLVQQISSTAIPPAPAMNIGCYPAQQMSINVPSPPEIQASPVAAAVPQTEEKPKKLVRPEDMKVNDLKAELKARGQPVSGAKPALLVRLRTYLQSHPEDVFATLNSPAPSNVGSPQEIKQEAVEQSPKLDSGGSSSAAASDSSMSDHKTFEFQVAPAASQTLSFMQLDPLQQQQATAIAIQTLASQMRSIQANANAAAGQQQRQLQNMHMNAIPANQMDVDKSPHNGQQNSNRSAHTVHTLPTIFLATTQQPPGGTASLTFQSTPLQVPPNSVPCIITMNGLNSTLNLLNGFNIVQNNSSNTIEQKNDHQFSTGPIQTSQQAEPDPVGTFTQNLTASTLTTLQQHLQQKILHQQMQRERKQANEPSPASSSSAAASAPVSMDVYQEPTTESYQHGGQNAYSVDRHGNDCLDAMLTDEAMEQQPQHDCQDGGGFTADDVANCFANCSYSPQLSDCVRSEAIDDILEILIRNDEIPASAAQEALPKNLILQHTKPNQISQTNPFQQIGRIFQHPSPHYPGTIDDMMQPSNSCPLPPISSISPANHGSPVSSTGETNESSLFQQQLALYLLQNQQSIDNNALQHDHQQQQQHQPMDYQCDSYSQQNSDLDNGDGTAWLNSWLQQGMTTTAPAQEMTDDRDFKQEDMQAESFPDLSNHMDQSENPNVDQTFFDFFDEFPNLTTWNGASDVGNGGYLTGSNPSPNMYWLPETEQML